VLDENQEIAIKRLKSEHGWHEHHARVGAIAKFHCEYCNRDMLGSIESYDSWQLDHIIPSSQHGSDDIDNKALVCKTCNFMKGSFVPEGTDRESRIRSAKEYVTKRRELKSTELQRIREIAGYPSASAA
jgi:5-methylcytosine-specific restriction endonuclease McrA